MQPGSAHTSGYLVGYTYDQMNESLHHDLLSQAHRMTKLDRVTQMPARTFLYGFLGFIAVASTVMMFADPLDPEIGNSSANPGDWTDSKLKTYLTDVLSLN